MKGVFFNEWMCVVFLFFIPYSFGAFLYGVLDWNNKLHIPILILSLILFYLLLKKYESIKRNQKEVNKND